MVRKAAKNASVAAPIDGVRLNAPSAERNADALGDLIQQIAPKTGRVLEIASGTGQHMAVFAPLHPDLHWQPSEPDPERRASIDAYCGDLNNVAKAIDLDATRPGWAAENGGYDLIFLVNLLHLISWPEADVVIENAAKALGPGGMLMLYGPFMRAGILTSPGDASFHATLVAQDPDVGYKNDQQIGDHLRLQGLELAGIHTMPANNLAFVARKPA
ncbi:MAG: DUF938 domain-containing protein [Sedimentitalea sp.]